MNQEALLPSLQCLESNFVDLLVRTYKVNHYNTPFPYENVP